MTGSQQAAQDSGIVGCFPLNEKHERNSSSAANGTA